MLSMLHERQTDDLCTRLFVYDDPPPECQRLPTKMSSTHQILITLARKHYVEAMQISLFRTSTPQLHHMGTYVYNSSSVMHFITLNDKRGRVLVRFERVVFRGHKGLDCEYGGLFLSSPEGPLFNQSISTEILYCDQFMPYFEVQFLS